MATHTPIPLEEIERRVRALHREMWDKQVSLWPGEKVTPLDVCDPEKACLLRGYDYREGWLDDVGSSMGRYELAGFIDRTKRLIAVSEKCKPEVRRFTGAHELGHLEMHPGLHHHRERPLEGLTVAFEWDPIEREANQFAGCFLVPRKQLRLAFQACFKTEQLRMTDIAAYDLAGDDGVRLLNAHPKSLMFESAVAKALRYRGCQFESLHRTFRVSVTTMAIRLRETGLVLV